MPAVNVTAIRVKENCLPIIAEGPLLDFATSWSQRFWRAAFRRHSIQVLPTFVLAGENDAIFRGPVNHSAASVVRHVRKRILQFSSAVPHCLCVPRSCIRNPDV